MRAPRGAWLSQINPKQMLGGYRFIDDTGRSGSTDLINRLLFHWNFYSKMIIKITILLQCL
jgi:hypothetical protein